MALRNPKWDFLDHVDLQKLIDVHGTIHAFAEHLGVTERSLAAAIRRRGIPIRLDRSRRKKKPSQLDRLGPILKHLASKRWSCSRIAEALRLNVQEEQVRRWLHGNGVAVQAKSGAQAGIWNHSFRDGRYLERREYVQVKRQGKWVKKHRWLAMKRLGKPLPKGAVVDHIDGDPTNNEIENLRIFPNNAEHLREHHKRWRAAYRVRRAKLRRKDRKYVKNLLRSGTYDLLQL